MDHATSRALAKDDRNAWAKPGLEDLGGGLYRIPLPLPNDALTAVNVYAMTGEHGVDLVDAGMASIRHATGSPMRWAARLRAARHQELLHHPPSSGPLHARRPAAEHPARSDHARRARAGQHGGDQGCRRGAGASPGSSQLLPALGAAGLAEQVRAILAPGLANPRPKLEWDDPDHGWATARSSTCPRARCARFTRPGTPAATWSSTMRRAACCSPATTCCRTSPRRSVSSPRSPGRRSASTWARCG